MDYVRVSVTESGAIASSHKRWFSELAQECEHTGIEQVRSLQGSEVTYTLEQDEFSARNGLGQELRVIAPDEFVEFTLYDRHRHLNPRQIACGIVRLCSLHQRDSGDEFVEFLRCGR